MKFFGLIHTKLKAITTITIYYKSLLTFKILFFFFF